MLFKPRSSSEEYTSLSLCVEEYLCMYLFGWVYARDWHQVSSSIALPDILRQSCSLNLKLFHLMRLAGSLSPESFLSQVPHPPTTTITTTLSPPGLRLQMCSATPGSYYGATNLNTDPHACMTSVSLIKPFPQPFGECVSPVNNQSFTLPF